MGDGLAHGGAVFEVFFAKAYRDGPGFAAVFTTFQQTIEVRVMCEGVT